MFLAGNQNLLVFGTGFVVCLAGIGAYSEPLARVVAGVILMAIAVYPLLRAKDH